MTSLCFDVLLFNRNKDTEIITVARVAPFLDFCFDPEGVVLRPER